MLYTVDWVDPCGHKRGIERYPGCDYAASTRYVFYMNELVRYVMFRDVLAGSMERSQG